MDYKSDYFDASVSNDCLYQGVLITGEPVLCISGRVNEEDCCWAIQSLDDLIADGKRQIVFDCSGVEKFVKNWFSKKIQQRVAAFEGDLKIRIRDFSKKLDIEVSRTAKQHAPKCNSFPNAIGPAIYS